MTLVAHLIVQVRAGATTRITTLTNDLTSRYPVVGLDADLREVTVVGLQSVVVTDDNKITITASNKCSYTYTTIERSIYRIARLQIDVRTLMHTTTARTILRRHTALERVVIALERIHQVDYHRYGQILLLDVVGLDLVVPVLGVYGLVQYVDIAVTHILPCVVVVEYDVQTLA